MSIEAPEVTTVDLANTSQGVTRAAGVALLGLTGLGLAAWAGGLLGGVNNPYAEAVQTLQEQGGKFRVCEQGSSFSLEGFIFHESSTPATFCREASGREVLKTFNSTYNWGLTLVPDGPAQKELTGKWSRYDPQTPTMYLVNPKAVNDYVQWRAGRSNFEPWVEEAVKRHMPNLKLDHASAAPVFEVLEALRRGGSRVTFTAPSGLEFELQTVEQLKRLDALYGTNAAHIPLPENQRQALLTLDYLKTPSGKPGTGWPREGQFRFNPLTTWTQLEKGEEVRIDFKRPDQKVLQVTARTWDDLVKISERANAQREADLGSNPGPMTLENAHGLGLRIYDPYEEVRPRDDFYRP